MVSHDIRLKSNCNVVWFDLVWDSTDLYYSVREPQSSNNIGSTMVFGKVDVETSFKKASKMAENEILISDGIEPDTISFHVGNIATISLSVVKGTLVC